MVSDNRLALDFSYELDLWGKNRSRLKSAVSQQAAAAADAQAARNLLASAVVRAYLNLQNGFAQRSVLKRVLAQRADDARTDARPLLGRPGHAGRGQAGGIIAGRGQGRTDASRDHAGAAAQPGRGAGRRRPAARPVADRDGAGRAGRRRARQRAAGPAGPPSRRGGRALARRSRASRHRHCQGRVLSEHQPDRLRRFPGHGHRQPAGRGLAHGRHRSGDLAAHLPRRRAQRQSGGPPRGRGPGGLGLQPVRAGRRAPGGRCARRPAPAGPGTGRAAPGARRHRGGLRPGRQALQGRHGQLPVGADRADGRADQARLDTDLRIRAYQLDADLAYALGGGYTRRARRPDAQPAPAGATTH